MNKLIFLLSCCVFLFSCGQVEENATTQTEEPTTVAEPTVLEEPITTEEVAEPEMVSMKEAISIKFEDFSMMIDSMEQFDGRSALQKTHTDTATMYLELGEDIDGKRIRIKQDQYDKVKVYEQYENSITIMGEGPHCDLIDWKHYYSGWQALEKNNGDFIAKRYTQEDWNKFTDVDIQEVKDAVKIHCEGEWYKMIENIKTPTESPCGVSTSRIFFKVVLENSSTGSMKERILVVEVPMGC